MITKPIRLIVNADDLGAGRQRDLGIFRAFREGIVTSSSLLANGSSFVEAARAAKDLALPVGVHLNLSEGSALSGSIRGLTDDAGNFLGKIQSRKILAAGEFDRDDGEKELAAQVERVLAAGLVPDHLDTHQHFCLFPAATPLVIETAKNFAISFLRHPLPMEPAANDPGGVLGEELALYRRLVSQFSAGSFTAGIHTPDGLFGMPFLDRLDEATLPRILQAVPPGFWELMVHPGFADPSDPFSGPARETELTALISPLAREIIRARDIQLITFGDLPCAS